MLPFLILQSHFTQAKWTHHRYKVQCQPHHPQRPTCCHPHRNTIRPSISTWRRRHSIQVAIHPSTWYKHWTAIQRHRPSLPVIGPVHRRVPIGRRAYNRRVPITSTYRVAIRPIKVPRPFTFDNESKKGVVRPVYTLFNTACLKWVNTYRLRHDNVKVCLILHRWWSWCTSNAKCKETYFNFS